VYYLVHENKKAWHAGISSWRGREGMNDYSIGIELVNNGFQAFPEKQMDALIELCLGIMDRHNIDQRNVIGHFDVAPKRKIDPNEFFDWKKLFENGYRVVQHSIFRFSRCVVLYW
jgi:N-acetylmuramoyl-L-alanine amidase